eukprot:maker-scaffold332_size203095-snap-gene-1.22 protein:Tk10839 transcript:maker-scaffold332_size203095-snap-gene-1.22-mRNA-1 annotation:"va3_solri ame: full"
MKIFIGTLVILGALILHVDAGCEVCNAANTFNAFFPKINGGPCFNYNFENGPKTVCLNAPTGFDVAICSDRDPLCKLNSKPVDCGSPSTPANGGLGPKGGDPTKCTITTYKVDCAQDTKFYKCRFGDDHTMAQTCGAQPECGEVCSYGISSQADIDRIVNKHNELRSKVARGEESQAFESSAGQPAAKNMKKLTWNSELAKVAQRFAAKCQGFHDANDARLIAGVPSVGQNYAGGWSSAPYKGRNYESQIQSWYNEVNDMNPSVVNGYRSSGEGVRPKEGGNGFKAIGHYTQVVWAETDQVGCGVIVFKKDNWYQERFICNYAKAGNMGGGKVYEVAANPSEIGSGCTGTVEDGLCV